MKISFKINDLIEVEYTDEKYQENLNENHNLVILVPENQEQIWRNIDNSEEVQQIGGVFVNQCKKYIDKQKSEDLDFNRYLQFAFSREIPKSLGFWSLYKDKTVKSFKSRTFIFSEIEKDFENMAINYHNLSTRLLYYNAIKDNFVKLWEIRSLNAESNELLVMLNQFIKNNNPENLNKKQLGILCNAINKLESNKIADEDLDEIFDDLIDSGMEFFPTIEGYSDRCED